MESHQHIYITYLDKGDYVLYQHLKFLLIWLSREFVNDRMFVCFKDTFPKTKVIIDCTEFFIEMPSSYSSQSVTFSSYKNQTPQQHCSHSCRHVQGIFLLNFSSKLTFLNWKQLWYEIVKNRTED